MSFRLTRDRSTRTTPRFGVLSLLVLALGVVGCARNAAPPATPAASRSDEQQTVDEATLAIERMRRSGEFSDLDQRIRSASGVMIFPRVVKAALLLGGGGGRGVLLARDRAGGFSAPAFYTLGGGSAGLALGYEEASVVVVFADRPALLTVVERGLTLGADATIAAGSIGAAGANASATAARDVYTYVDVGGVFVGASLDGSVVAADEARNRRYYGPSATTWGIVVDQRYDDAGANGLRAVLAGG